MRLTARGIRNYQDKVEARQDKREQTIMDLYGKGGTAALRKIFNNSTVDNRGINLFKRKKKSADLDFSPIDRDSLNPIFTDQDLSMDEQGYLELLENKYNISDDTVARLIANGDPTVFQRIYERTLEKAKYYEETLDIEAPDSIVSNIIENAAIVPAGSGGKLNIDKVEAYIGREMDSVIKSLLQQEGVQRGRVILGDVNLRKDVGPEKASKYVNEAVQYTVMHAQLADKRISEEIEFLRQISQPKDQNTTGRTLTEKEKQQQEFLLTHQQRIQNALQFFADNKVSGMGNPIRLFELYGVSGLMSEISRLPNLLNEPNIRNYTQLYGGEEGKDGRMVIEVPVFSGEESNAQAILKDNYDPRKVDAEFQSFLHRLYFTGILHEDTVIQLVAGEDGIIGTAGKLYSKNAKLGKTFSRSKKF